MINFKHSFRHFSAIVSVFVVVTGLTLLTEPFKSTVYAQSTGIPVKCGDIVDSEFKQGANSPKFLIDVKAGDKISVSGKGLGDVLQFYMTIYGPDGTEVGGNGAYSGNPTASTGVLSADGTYEITTGNSSIGVFTLYIGCTLRNGTVINPGDNAQPAIQPTPSTSNTGTAFSGNGFPGIAPVDFSKAVKLKLSSDGTEDGEITPAGGEVFNFSVNAKANAVLNIDFSRTAGNMNLGLVVLSSDNKVICLETLVASSSLTTTVTIPTDGQYIIGIFAISLFPPSSPVATDFEAKITSQ